MYLFCLTHFYFFRNCFPTQFIACMIACLYVCVCVGSDAVVLLFSESPPRLRVVQHVFVFHSLVVVVILLLS
jgi:hypothetical protein